MAQLGLEVAGLDHRQAHEEQHRPQEHVHQGHAQPHGDDGGGVVRPGPPGFAVVRGTVPQAVVEDEPAAERGGDHHADRGQPERGQDVGHVPDGGVEDAEGAGGSRGRHTAGQGRQQAPGLVAQDHADQQPQPVHPPGQHDVGRASRLPRGDLARRRPSQGPVHRGRRRGVLGAVPDRADQGGQQPAGLAGEVVGAQARQRDQRRGVGRADLAEQRFPVVDARQVRQVHHEVPPVLLAQPAGLVQQRDVPLGRQGQGLAADLHRPGDLRAGAFRERPRQVLGHPAGHLLRQPRISENPYGQ